MQAWLCSRLIAALSGRRGRCFRRCRGRGLSGYKKLKNNELLKISEQNLWRFRNNEYILLSSILHNPVPCGADGLLGDAHDSAHGLVVHAHFIEDEKEKQALADCISKRFRTFAATNNIELCQSLPEHIRLNQAGIY